MTVTCDLSRTGHLRPRASRKLATCQTVWASVAEEVEELMADYPGVVNSSQRLPVPHHQVEHVIETTCGHPVQARYRRLDPDKLAAAKAEFQSMEQQGIIRRSKSHWSSPLHMVKKKDGT